MSDAAEYQEITGDFTDESAFDLSKAQAESLSWIGAVLNETFPADKSFRENLRDGKKLCRFINCIIPNAVPRINRLNVAFACMENITQFLNACRSLGLKDTQLFVSTDLYGGQDAVEKGEGTLKREIERQERDVCITIYWLGRAVRELPDYHGPQLNLAVFVRMACTRCNDIIDTDDFVVSGSNNFHKECFRCDTCRNRDVDPAQEHHWDGDARKLACKKCLCTQCKTHLFPNAFRPLDDGPLQEVDKICPECDKTNACGTCGVKCHDKDPEVVEDNDKKYCRDCHCHDDNCKKPFPLDAAGQKECVINPENNRPYCLDWACGTCGKFAGEGSVEKDGKKFCPECHCAETTCQKVFALDAAGKKIMKIGKNDGKPYCPDCICAHPGCCKRIGRTEGDTIQVPPCADFPNGAKVCKACACILCCSYITKGQSYLRRGGSKYCSKCFCISCKVPLIGYPADGARDEQGRAYCLNCRCVSCAKVLPRKSSEIIIIAGEKLCPDCVCSVCEIAIDNKETAVQSSATGKPVCAFCLCSGCKTPTATDARTYYGEKFYCAKCVCASCHKPATKLRGQLRDIEGKSFCATCLCKACSVPLLSGESISYRDYNFCKSCACATCHVPLTKREKIEVDGEVICQQCACVQCKTKLTPENTVVSRKIKTCTGCACSRCNRPEINTITGHTRKAYTVEDGKKVCADCRCKLCSTPLANDEDIYCGKCVCQDCGLVLDDDEEAFCSECGPSQPGFVSKKDRRKAKKTAKLAT